MFSQTGGDNKSKMNLLVGGASVSISGAFGGGDNAAAEKTNMGQQQIELWLMLMLHDRFPCSQNHIDTLLTN